MAMQSSDPVSEQFCQRVKDLRAQREWSLEELSAASGVSRSMLSQIERGAANPTLAVTAKIAQAFGLSLGELIDTAATAKTIEVVRGNEENAFFRMDRDCQIRTLSPLHLEKDVEIYEVRLAEGRSLNSTAHFKGTREFLTVQKGKVRLKSGEQDTVLQKGDSASYRADLPHCIENLSHYQAILFLVVIYQ